MFSKKLVASQEDKDIKSTTSEASIEKILQRRPYYSQKTPFKTLPLTSIPFWQSPQQRYLTKCGNVSLKSIQKTGESEDPTPQFYQIYLKHPWRLQKKPKKE